MVVTQYELPLVDRYSLARLVVPWHYLLLLLLTTHDLLLTTYYQLARLVAPWHY